MAAQQPQVPGLDARLVRRRRHQIGVGPAQWSGPQPLRRCIGSTRFGIETHEAPETELPAQPRAKDGLGRMCHTHWRQYRNALRKVAVARKAEEPAQAAEPEPEVAPEAPAHEHTLGASLLGEGQPIEAPAPRRTRRIKAEAKADAEVAAG